MVKIKRRSNFNIENFIKKAVKEVLDNGGKTEDLKGFEYVPLPLTIPEPFKESMKKDWLPTQIWVLRSNCPQYNMEMQPVDLLPPVVVDDTRVSITNFGKK